MPYQPADIPEKYKNTINDLLLAILNSLPVPNGDPGTVLDGTLNWSIPTAATLPTGQEGDILTFQAGAWRVFPRHGIFTYNNFFTQINLAYGDTINFNGASISARLGGGINVGGLFQTGDLVIGNKTWIPNKLGTGLLNTVERITSGAEAAINLYNVNSINTNLSGDWLPRVSGGSNLGSNDLKFGYGHFMYNVVALGFTTGEAQWKLGQKLAGAVTMDTSNFIQVTINGVQHKLLIAN